jgi:hypothetical protein
MTVLAIKGKPIRATYLDFANIAAKKRRSNMQKLK